MIDDKKKYVAYDPITYGFKGFYSEGRKDLPEFVDEIDRENFRTIKGKHTHYNPETKVFYTPEEDILANTLEAEKLWRDSTLRETDIFMLEDYPISAQEKVDIKRYRQDLREFPVTKVKPEMPDVVKEKLGYTV